MKVVNEKFNHVVVEIFKHLLRSTYHHAQYGKLHDQRFHPNFLFLQIRQISYKTVRPLPFVYLQWNAIFAIVQQHLPDQYEATISQLYHKEADEKNRKLQSPAKRSNIHPPIYSFFPGIHTPYLDGIPPTPNARCKATDD